MVNGDTGTDGLERIDKCVIESCSGWRLNKVLQAGNNKIFQYNFFQLPEVKNFIYSDFESKFDRTVFKKIPGKAPEAIFYTQSGKEVERLNIEKFDR